jgi:hypothetical protein
MWAIVNRTRYAVGKSWARDKNGAHEWLVAVRATFDLAPNGHLALAAEQSPALLSPEYWGDPATTSVRYETDVVPPKPTTDVLVEGSAHAPRARATPRVVASVGVADVRKSIVVHGPRRFSVGPAGTLSTTDSDPFLVRPIRYEEAFGGVDLGDPEPRRQLYDTRNPVGRGVARDLHHLHGQPAHTIEYPGGEMRPAGFGPIASFWSPRRERCGTYGSEWERTKKPLLPDDYDERSLQCAPDDQRPSQHLRGEEEVVLENMTPDGVLRFRLPKIYPTFSTWFGSRSEEHRARLGTVLIQPDEGKLILVWQTSLRVAGADVDYLEKTVISEKAYVS